MFLAPSSSDLGESLPTINLLGVYLGELAGKTPTVSEDFGFGDGFSPESEFEAVSDFGFGCPDTPPEPNPTHCHP